MHYLLTILFFFSAIGSFGFNDTEVYSVYFAKAAKPGTKSLRHVSSKFYQHYQLEEQTGNELRTAAGDALIVDETGIYIQKNKLLSISKEEVRENSKYWVRNGYLHGVISNDSVMVALEKDTYYFLIPGKSYLYETGNKNAKLYQGLTPSDYLILSTEDHGYYSALYVSFSPQKVALKELDFQQKELDFRQITNTKQQIEKIPAYILNPTTAEWQSLMNHFVTYDSYILASI